MRLRPCILGRNSTEMRLHSSKEAHDVNLPSPGEVHFDHLLRLVSARFFYQKVTIFPFVIGKYFMEIHCSITPIACSSNIHLPVSASLTSPAWISHHRDGCLTWIFPISITNWQSLARKSLPFSPIGLFTYLTTSVWSHGFLFYSTSFIQYYHY